MLLQCDGLCLVVISSRQQPFFELATVVLNKGTGTLASLWSSVTGDDPRERPPRALASDTGTGDGPRDRPPRPLASP